MTFQAFSAHLTQIICPFRVSPSRPLFRLYFSLEICNPCSKELLTWWTCVVLVNAAIEVSKLVKTCAFAAAMEFVVNGECKPGHSSWCVCVAWKGFRERGEGQAAWQRFSHLSVGHSRGFLMESLCKGSRGYQEHRVFLSSRKKLPLQTLSRT